MRELSFFSRIDISMGRKPCCSKEEGLNRGAWTAAEDKILTDHILPYMVKENGDTYQKELVIN